MEKQLFKDSEVFVKERPTKLTESQQVKIYKELATEIIENNWSNNDIDDIIEDLKTLSKSTDSGYERAKSLEGYGTNASYRIDTSFIEWLDDFEYHFYSQLIENVKKWVKAHDIKTKFEKRTELVVVAYISRSTELKIGEKIFVNGFYEDEAKYKVYNELDSKRNLLAKK